MAKIDFVMFCMNWISGNVPLLVQLLTALVPVLALCVAGYALHTVRDKK